MTISHRHDAKVRDRETIDQQTALEIVRVADATAPPSPDTSPEATNGRVQTGIDRDATDPRPAAVTFVTTEHFTLQGARSRTISELSARASIFLATVSGPLIALGLMATATHIGTAFYALALILLPTLAFIGFVTFQRTLQTGLEDHSYAHRIARLRGYYFHHAPELTAYLLSVPADKRLAVQGLPGGRRQGLLTVAGMIAVITSLMVGATAGVLGAAISHHTLAPSLAAGGAAAAVSMSTLMRHGSAAWKQLAKFEEQTPYE